MNKDNELLEDFDDEEFWEEEEEEEEEDEESEDENEDSEDENEEEENLSPADIKKMRDALAKANAEAKKYRLELKKVRKDTESEDEAKIREAEERTANTFKARIVKSEAKVALIEAGLTGKVDRFIKMIDLDEIELNENGELEGLGDQVKQIKSDFPEMFEKRIKTPGPGDGGRGGRPKDDKNKSSAQRLAAQIMGDED